MDGEDDEDEDDDADDNGALASCASALLLVDIFSVLFLSFLLLSSTAP